MCVVPEKNNRMNYKKLVFRSLVIAIAVLLIIYGLMYLTSILPWEFAEKIHYSLALIVLMVLLIKPSAIYLGILAGFIIIWIIMFLILFIIQKVKSRIGHN